jgi:DNA-binding transcriptional ArsR family regulator
MDVQPAAIEAVASPRRRAILRLVWDRELSSRAIASHFDVSWPAISQNLNVLKHAGLVVERRDGAQRLYRADRARLGPLEAALVAMWDMDLDRLAELAESDKRKKRK